MKRLLAMCLFFFVGALIVSAGIFPPDERRVSWIPIEESEFQSFDREINDIEVDLIRVDDNGKDVAGYGIGGSIRNKIDSWLDLQTEISNSVSKGMSLRLPSLYPLGTNRYYVKISLRAYYSTNGLNSSLCSKEEFATSIIKDIFGTMAYAKSPMFVFPPRVDGKQPVPLEAFDLPIKWEDSFAGMPAFGKGIKWVDYTISEKNNVLYQNIVTKNGYQPTCYPGYLNNGMLYISSSRVLDYARDAREKGCKAVVTVWYDLGRTDGTEWDLVTKEKREIYPPKLSIAWKNSVIKITFTGKPANVYTLESSPTSNFATTNIVGTVFSDSSGVATWSCDSSSPSQFFRARPAQAGETP